MSRRISSAIDLTALRSRKRPNHLFNSFTIIIESKSNQILMINGANQYKLGQTLPLLHRFQKQNLHSRQSGDTSTVRLLPCECFIYLLASCV